MGTMSKQTARRWYGAMSDAQVRRVYDKLAAVIDPKSDLHYRDPFELLVAVVLSAQATDVSVNAATAELYQIANTPEGIAALGVDGLRPYIRRIGLYNNKATNIVALSEILLREHGGAVPNDRAALEALPGVGRKSANVVLNVAFGEATIAVDTHIHRVANRLGIAQSTTPTQTEAVLMARTPRKHRRNAHHYLILHGRYCCKARRPECWRCPIERQCRFPDKPAPRVPARSR